ncbi:uncharacterized protein LOC128991274 isoform X3 [Macrosteles quadrilineatus]|uniref:uncharacterized protein LOC128991274 isoform X3 n=1 Tax=Macrosteles quadrilineatus TaxID=74068 RepID=UPI0023E10DB2|nr:uncharacterized protein LOC128991274 isoform X3 [Macrosteles quadrilineatus]
MSSVQQLSARFNLLENKFSVELYVYLEALGSFVDRQTNVSIFLKGLRGLKADIQYIEKLALLNRSLNKLGLNQVNCRHSCILSAIFIVYNNFCTITKKSKSIFLQIFQEMISRLETEKFDGEKFIVSLLKLNFTLNEVLYKKKPSRQRSDMNHIYQRTSNIYEARTEPHPHRKLESENRSETYAAIVPTFPSLCPSMNVVEEELNVEERKAAWEDYENDKKRGFMPPAGPQGTSVNPSPAWNQQIELIMRQQQLKLRQSVNENDESEIQQKSVDGSEKSLDSYPEDGQFVETSENDLEPEPAFVPEAGNEPEPAYIPVADIKTEPVEPEENYSLDDYSGNLNLNPFASELNVKDSCLTPKVTFEPAQPPNTLPNVMFGNATSVDAQMCRTSETETVYYPPSDTYSDINTSNNTHISNIRPNTSNLTPHIELRTNSCQDNVNFRPHDAHINVPQRVISGSDEDFTSLKHVVQKLEDISNRLAFTTDPYEEFGKYLATLLRGIPYNKFLSLKQKFVDDVFRSMMALQEINRPTTVQSASNLPSEYWSAVRPNQVNPFQSTSSGGVCVASSTKPNIPSCTVTKDFSNSAVPLTVPNLPTASFAQMSPRVTENRLSGSSSSKSNGNLKRPTNSSSRKCQKKPHIEALQDHSQQQFHVSALGVMEDPTAQPTQNPLRDTGLEDTFEIEIEESKELQDIKVDITGTVCKSEIPEEPDPPQNHLGAMQICEQISPTDKNTLPIADGKSMTEYCSLKNPTTNFTCQKCNLDFHSSIDLKRHSMVSHAVEMSLAKTTRSAGNQSKSRFEFQHSNPWHTRQSAAIFGVQSQQWPTQDYMSAETTRRPPS